MAETHRRVEPRSIVGTGMSTDPERIREIEARKARMERDYNLPKKGFGEVFGKAPKGQPKDTQWVDEPPQKEKRSARGVPDPKAGPGDKEEKKDGEGAPKDANADGEKPAGKDAAPADAEPVKPKRPVMGSPKPAVGSTVGVRGRVAFKV